MSTRTPRSILVLLLTLAAALAALASPSLATALEAPQTLKPELWSIGTSSAILQGVLSPHSAGETGATYEFVYRATESGECKGAGESSTTPGMALGGEAEPVSEPVEGLSQQTVYAACLVEHNQAKTEEALGPAITFLTGPPEAPEGEEATNITATSATLKATLNSKHDGEPGFYVVRYQQSATECEGYGSKESQLFVAHGHEGEVVEVAVNDLSPAATYTFCVLAFTKSFASSSGASTTFTTPAAPPMITGEAVVSTGPGEATVSAEINPGGLAGSYSVEYEPGKSTPEEPLPASSTAVAVRQRITSLQPGTEYHYRFVAHNVLGATQGESSVFTTNAFATAAGNESSCPNATFAGFSPTLPDCRAYELVSNATEVGDVYDPGGELEGREQDVTTERPFRAAADGDAVVYVGDPGSVGGEGSSAKGAGNEYLATRGADTGVSGWKSVNINPPRQPGEGESYFRRYEAFSPDLSVGIVAAEQPLLAAGPSQRGPDRCAVLYAHEPAGEEYNALFTETQTPGYCGEMKLAIKRGDARELTFAGESNDHSQRFFQSAAALVAPAVEGQGVGGNLYDSLRGALDLVNRLPNGEIAQNSTFGAPSELGSNGPNFGNAVASDGTRVFWSTVEEAKNYIYKVAAPLALYAREDPASPSARTVQLDLAQNCAGCTSGRGEFWAASADGARVFFTDCNRLTADSTAENTEGCNDFSESIVGLLGSGNDLYEYDFSRPAGERLLDLTVDHNSGDPLGADVQGVIGASTDGSYVYFIADGSLSKEANSLGERSVPRKCERPLSLTYYELFGQGFGCNLYEIHDDNGKWTKPRFIATLEEPDDVAISGSLVNPGKSFDEVAGDLLPSLGSRTAEVTPDGRRLIFESGERLTGYDASPDGVAESVEVRDRGDSEVFVYDANTNRLTCASCNPTGAPPVPSIASGGGTDPYLPVSSSGTFMHRWINAQGTEAFFDSNQPLVPGDSNGVQDVYEWEAEGAPSCPTSTSIYGGCVFLLSGGESADWSFLVDADETGENVFIVHRGALGGAGPNDDKAHLYDVRVGGGFDVSTTACTGTGCQGVPPAAPIFATPASATFNGVGNLSPGRSTATKRTLTRSQKLARALKACRRPRGKARRKACERRARLRYESNSSTSVRRSKSIKNGRKS